MTDITKFKKAEELKSNILNLISSDDLIKLAKEGSCPYYLVSNPITKEEQIFFVQSEVLEWVTKTIVLKQTPINYKFIYFDKEAHKIDDFNKVPTGLIRIKELYQLPRTMYGTPSGIYFLCKDKEVVYIGQSYCILSRTNTHISNGFKDFDEIYFIECPIPKLFELETALINYYKPKYNEGKSNKPTTKNHIKIVEELVFKKETICN